MKILLLNLPKNISNIYDEDEVVPPLGLAYISSVLKASGEDVKLLDTCALKLNKSEILKTVQQEATDIVGVSIMTPRLPGILEVVRDIKRLYPNIKIIAGGPHPTVEYASLLRTNLINFCVIGEGESTVVELIRAIKGELDLKFVKGIAFKEDERVIKTESTDFIWDLDNLPFPDWESLPVEKYWEPLTAKKNYARIFTSRGCPYTCIFCSQDTVHGRKFRKRSPDNVIREIRLLYEKYGVRDLNINDSIFNISEEHARGICRAIIDSGLNITWRCTSRVDRVDIETLKLMKKAGCRMVSYGVESGDPRIQKVIRKNIKLDKVYKVFEMTKEAGIRSDALFMLGLPGETEETMNATIQMAKKLNADMVHFGIAIPFPGTEFFEIALKENKFDSDKIGGWERFDFYAGIYTPNDLTIAQIKKALKKANRSFFLRPSYLLKQLLNIYSFNDLKFKVKGAIRVLKR